ncbi:MAG: winged helix-turn-helix domain-containing protein, partial [Myxococcota bacterium]
MSRWILGALDIDLAAARVVRGERADDLTAREVDALRYLLERLGQTVTREELEREVWGFAAGVLSEAVPVCIRRLRQKIEEHPDDPRLILTVRGTGWTMRAPERDADVVDLTSTFVGREVELDALTSALDRDRCVTVVGPAGAGKTRLVREFVRGRRTGRFAFVALGSATRADRIDHDVSLGVRDTPCEAEAVGAALADQGPLVLILDECEAVDDLVRPRVIEWLREAPALRIVVTSRRPLGVPGEQRVPLGPLAEAQAAALFRDRARRVDPLAVLDDDAAIAGIAASVDALPLALELAAANVAVLGLARLRELLARTPLELLSADGALRQVVARSFDRLGAVDRGALDALSTFEGSFTLEDAAAVLELPAPSAVAPLRALAEQGLLRVVGDRYQLFAVVREACREALPVDAAAYERHDRWFARLGDVPYFYGMPEDAIDRAAIFAGVADLDAAIGRGRDAEVVGRCGVARLIGYLEGGSSQPAYALVHALRVVPSSASVRFTVEHVAADLFSVWEHRMEALERALAVATAPWQVASIRLGLAERNWGDASRAWAELEEVELDGLPDGLRSKYLSELASLDEHRHDELQHKAIVLARRAGSATREARAWAELALRADRDGRWPEAMDCAARAMDLAVDGDFWWVGGRTAAQVGLVERADELFALAEAFCAERLRTSMFHLVRLARARLRVESGETEAGLAQLRDERVGGDAMLGRRAAARVAIEVDDDEAAAGAQGGGELGGVDAALAEV